MSGKEIVVYLRLERNATPPEKVSIVLIDQEFQNFAGQFRASVALGVELLVNFYPAIDDS